MISLYFPGESALHKTSAGIKLLVLAGTLIAISLLPKTWLAASVSLLITIALYLLAGLSVKGILANIWKLKFLLLIVGIPQLLLVGVVQGSYNTVSVVTGILLAMLVTLTTKSSEIVSLIQKITRSENFGLLIALSLNAIALVGEIAKGIIEAGKARGVKVRPVRQITNLFVISLKNADDYAEALAARGVEV